VGERDSQDETGNLGRIETILINAPTRGRRESDERRTKETLAKWVSNSRRIFLDAGISPGKIWCNAILPREN